MDSSKLPAYRSSYLLRFHPYPRAKPSTRERIMASAWENEVYGTPRMSALDLESDISATLDQAVHGAALHVQSRQRRLSVSSLVELALFAKRLSEQKY